MLDLAALKELAERYPDDLHHPVKSFQIKGIEFGDTPSLMGVVNLSTDSWYRESVCTTAEAAIRRARRLTVEGAKLIDIGAESTLPQACRADADEQLDQLVPLLRELKDSVAISIETYLPQVAERCLEEGAAVLNMTGTGEADAFYRLAAGADAGVIICFVQAANVRDAGSLNLGDDPVGTQIDYFKREIDRATSAGVERLWIDPGLGFYYKNLMDSAERVRYQTRVFLESFRLRQLGWPVCHALPHAFETFGEEVRSAEAFFAQPALLGQASLLRTHEVAKVKAVVDTLNSINNV
jgi:dihydropteroate synthase